VKRPQFNVRVYGIIRKENKVLLSHEWNDELNFWKFPGGGVEHKEGTLDGLKRELIEELETETFDEKLFYVNEHFQQSAFSKESLLAFYYLVETGDLNLNEKQEIKWEKEYYLTFEWVGISDLKEFLSFPIDLIVAEKLSHQMKTP